MGAQPDKHVPPGGWPFWKHVLGQTYAEYEKDRILLVAGAVAFFAVTALVPAITAGVSLYALVSDPATVQSQFDQIRALMPDTNFELLKQQMQRIVSGQNRSGLWFIASVLIALWSAMSGMKGLINSLNIVYEVTDERGLLRYNLVALAMTLAAMAWLGLAIVCLVGVLLVLSYIPLGSAGVMLAKWARWPVLLVALMLGLAALYRFGPHRRHPRCEWISPGNVFAATGWLASSALISWYLSNFASYNAVYGSLGAAVALMLWLWTTAVIVLLGAELNSEFYKAKCALEGAPVEI